MAGKIHFTSGKTLDITDQEMRKIAPKLQNGGVRLIRVGIGHLVPLNSNTMEMIELIEEEEEKYVASEPEVEPQEVVEEKEEEPKKEETKQEKNDRIMADILAKSNCTHVGKYQLNYTGTKQGKNYFPVCTFCGKRERALTKKQLASIKDGENKEWTLDDIKNAVAWVER